MNEAKIASSDVPHTLKRELGVIGAVTMGMGSIVGTGVFVSIGIAASITGPAVNLAIVAAALVATCNALSSAQLAANHPVSGGTYEYGYRYLNPGMGFTAGWMFLCAKTASAATAALGFAGYFLHLIGENETGLVPIAVCAVVLLTTLVLSGLKRSNWLNIAIVAITLGSLTLFVLLGLPDLIVKGRGNLTPFFASPEMNPASTFFYATALMFVAYTGYGRIATMGEEVKEPRQNIPRAIVATLIISAVLYISVATVAIGTAGVEQFASATERSATPLEVAARALSIKGLDVVVAVGAITAMLGVLLNLILGLSRVLLAMGRQGDMPRFLARLSRTDATPSAAIMGVGLAIGALALTGSVETTWAFSAFTVLIYYAITNLAALRLLKEDRMFHPAFAVAGLIACLFLAFWVPTKIWLVGVGLIAIGLAWHLLISRFWRNKQVESERKILDRG